MAERILVGVVVGAQGLSGVLRVKSFTQNPADLAAYGPVEDESGRRLRLKVTSETKDAVMVRLEGVNDRTQAEALKGARFYVPRESLPAAEEDEYYLADLIGLVAERADGAVLGKVKAVHDFGAGVSIELEGPGASLVLPFTQDVVPVVDLAGRRLVVVPPAMTGDRQDEEGREGDGTDETEETEAHDGAR